MLEASTTYDERLQKNWAWCKTYFERKKVEFKITDWTIALDHAKKRLGQTDYNKKRITISRHFLRGPTCGEKQIRNTVLHEMAHILVGPLNPGHGEVWKKVALKIGCDGTTCSVMDLPDAKYVMTCPKKCFSVTYFRKPKIENKICLKCKNPPILKQLH